MKDKLQSPSRLIQEERNNTSIATDGYPTYPPNEDIYNKYREEENIDPEHLSRLKVPNEMDAFEQANEKDFEEDKSGDDLDVPGAELDDEQEAIGNEDEENNYYSLGGDDHNDLDEGRD